MRGILTILHLSLLLSLVACGERGASGAATQQSAMPASAIIPADPALAEIYQRSCRTCHGVKGSAAPLTGDVASWQPRLDQGMELMVQRVIEGYGGMPPLGMCFDCDEGQFQALIEFMASPASPEG